MVRLPLGQRSLARNAGKVKQRSTPDFGSRLAYSRRDSGGGVTGKRVYRNPGQTPRASRSDLTCSVAGLEILGLARRKATTGAEAHLHSLRTRPSKGRSSTVA